MNTPVNASFSTCILKWDNGWGGGGGFVMTMHCCMYVYASDVSLT